MVLRGLDKKTVCTGSIPEIISNTCCTYGSIVSFEEKGCSIMKKTRLAVISNSNRHTRAAILR